MKVAPHNCKVCSRDARSGFTLVEMLVATGLVVLIMLMFASIFGSAIGTITDQRGLANNDQKARIVTSILRSDLQNMTYRQAAHPFGDVQGIVPLSPGDELIIDPVNQRGYFYYSENDPNDDSDDVLQFTSQIRVGQRGDAASKKQQLNFSGKAGNLGVDNEPEQDDGVNGDQRSQSRAAEISYFLRNGVLYRRVLLIRDPLPRSTPLPGQPSALNGNTVFDTANRNYTTDNFYNTFDYSATRAYDDVTAPDSYLWFHTLDSLDNHRGQANLALGLPWNRFGHLSDPTATRHGRPREFETLTSGADGFFGRYTLAESSDPVFDWPGHVGPNPDPHTIGLSDADNDGIYDEYDDGDRQGEDILLTNVEGFNIEAWDTDAGSFVSLGGTGSSDYSGANPENGDYGPRNSGDNRIFDTWHPSLPVDEQPPYRIEIQPSAVAWTAGGTPAATDYYWFLAGEDNNLDGNLDMGEDRNSNGRLDYPGSAPSRSFYAAIVQVGTATGDREPEWPRTPGALVRDGDYVWEIRDNRVSLRAIRITVRFRDIGSSQPRQVTIVHSFVE